MKRPSSAIRGPQKESLSKNFNSNKDLKTKLPTNVEENKIQPKIMTHKLTHIQKPIGQEMKLKSDKIVPKLPNKPIMNRDIKTIDKVKETKKQIPQIIDTIQEPLIKIKLQENKIEEDIRVFKNQRSKLLQWYYSNLKLQQSFESQQNQAREEIFDRFMQYYELKQENFELQRLIQNHQKVSIIDDSLNIQYDALTDINEQWPQFTSNMEYLGQKLERSLNHLALGCDTIIEDTDLLQEQLSEINNQMMRSNHQLHNITPFVILTYYST